MDILINGGATAALLVSTVAVLEGGYRAVRWVSPTFGANLAPPAPAAAPTEVYRPALVTTPETRLLAA